MVTFSTNKSFKVLFQNYINKTDFRDRGRVRYEKNPEGKNSSYKRWENIPETPKYIEIANNLMRINGNF